MTEHEMLKLSERYHSLDVNAMDEFLTTDFEGEQITAGVSWNLAKQKEHFTQLDATDTIREQFASGNKICSWVSRTYKLEAGPVTYDFMQIKTVRDGKISHVYELYDRKQIEDAGGQKQ